jgi:hypothetical protein
MHYDALHMITIRGLVWNASTISHIWRQHRLTVAVLADACQHIVHDRVGHYARVRLLGLTAAGRMPTVILEPLPEDGSYAVVTAYPASRKDRRRHHPMEEIPNGDTSQESPEDP